MTITTAKTVRDIALEIPQATRIFEKLKIDYCCGGQKPLDEACATAGIDIKDVMEMLSTAEAESEKNHKPDFQRASLIELITYILNTHHLYTRDEMKRLEGLFDKVVSAHGQNHPELTEMRNVFQMLCAELRPHMFKEEEILFPYVVELERSKTEKHQTPISPFGPVQNPIRMMMMEHDTAGDLLRRLRTLSAEFNVPADGCISYETLYQALEAFEKDLHQHIHLENNILFPRALNLEAGE